MLITSSLFVVLCFFKRLFSLPFSSLNTHNNNTINNNRSHILLSFMAVEAHNMSFFMENRNLTNNNQGNLNLYNTQMDSGLCFNGVTPDLLAYPLYQSIGCDPVSAGKMSMNRADSGVTYNVPPTKKRPRDPININELDSITASQKCKISNGSSYYLDQELINHIQQQQLEVDSFIAQHNEKLRLELEEQRKRQSRMLIQSIRTGVAKKLKEKDEEIQRIAKLNWLLQEKVKSLCVENQIWRNLAQSNEATANTLRNNLEQVLAHVSEDPKTYAVAGIAEEAESSCGSNDDEGGRPCETAEKEKVAVGGGVNNVCKKCRVKESTVLLLPCRHLCLCTTCGSTLIVSCPACDSVTNACVHVNMSR